MLMRIFDLKSLEVNMENKILKQTPKIKRKKMEERSHSWIYYLHSNNCFPADFRCRKRWTRSRESVSFGAKESDKKLFFC